MKPCRNPVRSGSVAATSRAVVVANTANALRMLPSLQINRLSMSLKRILEIKKCDLYRCNQGECAWKPGGGGRTSAGGGRWAAASGSGRRRAAAGEGGRWRKRQWRQRHRAAAAGCGGGRRRARRRRAAASVAAGGGLCPDLLGAPLLCSVWCCFASLHVDFNVLLRFDRLGSGFLCFDSLSFASGCPPCPAKCGGHTQLGTELTLLSQQCPAQGPQQS